MVLYDFHIMVNRPLYGFRIFIQPFPYRFRSLLGDLVSGSTTRLKIDLSIPIMQIVKTTKIPIGTGNPCSDLIQSIQCS